MTCLRATRDTAAQALAKLPHANPRLEAELLLCKVLARSRSFLAAWPEWPLTAAQQATFTELLQRRLAGEPIAYLLGNKEFWSLVVQVTPAVLIPRPETELLVELALALGDRKQSDGSDRPCIVADLGTGSGVIAAALARERPRWSLYATDCSAAALTVAEANFHHLGLPVRTYRGTWYGALAQDLLFDLIISNPPYIPTGDPHLGQGDLPWEPRTALAAGADGLDALRILCAGAPQHLHNDGSILLEHGWDQGAAVRDLLRQAGFRAVRTWRDLAGQERVSGGRWSPFAPLTPMGGEAGDKDE